MSLTPTGRPARVHLMHWARSTFCGASHYTIRVTDIETAVTCTGCLKIYDREMLTPAPIASDIADNDHQQSGTIQG